MDISLLNPFAHAVPKSVDASISHANAACIAFNHSSTAPALLPSIAAGGGGAAAAAAAAAPAPGAAPLTTTDTAAAAAAEAEPKPTDNRPHSLFAGHYLAAGRLDGIVAIWDIETRSCLRWFDAHARQVTSLAWSPHGRYLASSSLDWNVIVWDLALKTGSAQPPRKRTIRFDAPVLEVRFSPVSSLLLLAVLESQQAYIIDLRRPKYRLEQVALADAHPHTTPQHEQAGPSAVVAPAAPAPAPAPAPATGNDDPLSAELPPYPLPPDANPTLTLEPSTYSTAAFTPDGKFIFAGTTKGHLHVVDPQTGKTLCKLNATSPAGIRALAFDRTGSKLVINVHDRTVRTFLVEYNHAHLSSAPGWPFPPASHSSSAQPNPEEDASATTTTTTTTTTMDLDAEPDSTTTTTTQQKQDPPALLLPVHKLIDLVNRTPWNGIGWSGDGGEYVYAGAAHKASHNIYIWDAATGTLEKVLQGPKDPLVDVDWHPTRPVIASVCSTGAIHFWFSKSEEAWSAYAPQFEELEENVQYEEREEEFDLEDEDELSRRKQDEEEALVDISSPFSTRHPHAQSRPPCKFAALRRAVARAEEEAKTRGGAEEREVGEASRPPEGEGEAEARMEGIVAVAAREGGAGSPLPVVPNGLVHGGSAGAPDGAVEAKKEDEREEEEEEEEAGAAMSITTGAVPAPAPAPPQQPATHAEGPRAPGNESDDARTRQHRAAYVWRWVRSAGEGDAGHGGFESDDDVDPCFVIPVQLEDGNSSSEGSSRSG
ncbi:chromatin binding protein [Tilletia horrida]|nr:chromatin binding protein [Tilletia horrida]